MENKKTVLLSLAELFVLFSAFFYADDRMEHTFFPVGIYRSSLLFIAFIFYFFAINVRDIDELIRLYFLSQCKENNTEHNRQLLRRKIQLQIEEENINYIYWIASLLWFFSIHLIKWR